MQQFDLSLWLQDKSRKVVTRSGHNVRILCTDQRGDTPIVALVEFETFDGVQIFYSDGKNIIHREFDLFFADEEKELTEFEKAVKQVMWTAYNYDDCSTGKDVDDISNVKATSKTLLDLAIKKIREEQQKKLGTLEMPIDVTEPYYIKGKQDALKDLPKLEKTKDVIDPTIPIVYTNATLMKTYVEYNGYKVCINDVFEKLPKEE